MAKLKELKGTKAQEKLKKLNFYKRLLSNEIGAVQLKVEHINTIITKIDKELKEPN